MGFHAYLQSNGIPFEGVQAKDLIIKHLNTLKKATKASQELADIRGEAPDVSGSGMQCSSPCCCS